jgi:CelD/BcsL family acetyltransferase involved in cellulose biosynthesis
VAVSAPTLVVLEASAVREGSSVQARVIDHIDDLRRLAPSWWELLSRAVHPQPTQTPLWLIAWWNAFGGTGGRELRVVVIESGGGEVLGIVPLLRRWVRHEGLIPVSTLELVGSGEEREDEVFSEYIGAIVARGHETVVAKAFAEALRQGRLGTWDELLMPAMSTEDPVVWLIAAALRAQTMAVEVTTTHECPCLPLPATWEAYLAELDGPRRYFVRRTLRDLNAWAGPGGAVLRRASNESELHQGWSILQDLHEERWKGGGAFSSAPFRRFHDAVMAGLLEGIGGTLDLLWLEVAGAPVAALYNIVYQGNVHFYQSGRKLDVPKNARPGIAIHLLAIRRAIEAGYHTYDFLARADPYKQKLAPKQRRHLVALSAIAPTARARAVGEMRRTARRIFGMARDFAGVTEAAPVSERGKEPMSERGQGPASERKGR